MMEHHDHWTHVGLARGWNFWFFMYLFTSDTVHPINKVEFLWRSIAGPLNFLGGL